MKQITQYLSKLTLWRVALNCAGILLLFACIFLFFSGASAQQLHFTDCADGTGNNGTVAIPLGTVVTGSFALETGDEIAVYQPSSSLCAGAIIYDETQTNVITVWGDDSQTNLTVDGMQVGEVMQWRIWDASEDAEYFAIVTYDPNSPFISDGAYKIDGLYALTSLMPNVPTAVSLAGAGAGDARPANVLLLFFAGLALLTTIVLTSTIRKME
jgi:hypothetical protein